MRSHLFVVFFLVLCVLVSCKSKTPPPEVSASTPKPKEIEIQRASVQTAQWLTVYWGWWSNTTHPNNLPFRTVGTHWVFFNIGLGFNATDSTYFGAYSAVNAAMVVGKEFSDSVHAAGKKSMICIGPGDFPIMWRTTRDITKSLDNLMYMVNLGKFDGVDLDWEPGTGLDQLAAKSPKVMRGLSDWIDSLRVRMPSPKILTTCMGMDRWLMDRQAKFDQVNAMSYDMSGAWWEMSWHNSPARNIPPLRRPSDRSILPSCQSVIEQGIANGAVASKLGFGISFYGYVWNGVTGPGQTTYTGVNSNWATNGYCQLMDQYSSYGIAWDDNAKTAYISAPGKFVSCDFDTGIVYKGKNLVPLLGTGGAIVYEAGAAYRPGQADPWSILKWCEYAFRNGPRPAKDFVPPPQEVTKTNMTIYDDALAPGFMWANALGAFDPANTEKVCSGSYAAKATMGGWGALIVNCGPAWGQEKTYYIDSLAVDIYCTASNTLGISYRAGSQPPNFTPPAGVWTHYVFPGPGDGVGFTSFFIGNGSGGTLQPVWFDNIRFVSRVAVQRSPDQRRLERK